MGFRHVPSSRESLEGLPIFDTHLYGSICSAKSPRERKGPFWSVCVNAPRSVCLGMARQSSGGECCKSLMALNRSTFCCTFLRMPWPSREVSRRFNVRVDSDRFPHNKQLSGSRAPIHHLYNQKSENLAQVFVMRHLLCGGKRLWNEKNQMQMAQAMLGEKPWQWMGNY